MLDADMPCLCSYRFAVTGMLQRRQQHSTAQAFAEWQLYVTARNDLRSIGARLAEQTKLNSLKLCFCEWWQQCEQQQASRLQKMAARVLQHWKVPPTLLTVCTCCGGKCVCRCMSV